MSRQLTKRLIIPTAIFSAVFLFSNIVSAHPGGTDSSGCHTCRTNCASWGLSTGEYHCHNAKTLPQPREPIKSTYGENGTGSTQPAPEYKNNSSNTPAVSATHSATKLTIPTTISKESDYSWLGVIAILGIGGGIGYWLAKRKKA